MNTYTRAILDAYKGSILPTLYPTLPILSGNVIALSDFGKSMDDDFIAWAEENLVANFLPVQDAPFMVTDYGTVNYSSEELPRLNRIVVEACKVIFNHRAWKKIFHREGAAGIQREYNKQIAAKVRGWDEVCAAIAIYGDLALGVPGLLNFSGIPQLTSTVNFSTATPQQMIDEILRIAKFVPSATNDLYTPTLMALPSNLYTILNRTVIGVNNDSVLDVIKRRLASEAPYNRMGLTWQITDVPQFNNDKIGTVLPDDAELIGLAVWELEEFLSPDNSESYDESIEGIASAHEGGIAGVVAKRPDSGLIVRYTY